MTESWNAFFFGAVDPAGSITVDKVPGFLWPQALSARIFGFRPWALVLPQVIEGVASVLVLYRVVRRWAGVVPGLLAAGIFTLTPITAVMFGHTLMEDPALTMCLILAADAWQRAAATARLRWLIVAGVWVGVGFQAKMLQAWAVLPAFAGVYLLVAPAALRRRLRDLAVAGVVMVVVSASWMLAATLTPAADRPYVDGTTNNSAFTMVVGYNGLSRFGDIHLPGTLVTPTGGGAPQGTPTNPRPTGAPGGASAGAGTPAQLQQLLRQATATGRSGWGKLIDAYLASQIGWLYPLAILALVAGLTWRRGMPRTDRLRGGYLMWGIWLLSIGVAFSAGEVAHAAYTAALAAPMAALAGAGIVTLWQAYRRGGRPAWLLPAAIAAEAAWTAYLSAQYASFLPWLLPVMLTLSAAGLVTLAVARTGGCTPSRLAVFGVVAAVAAMLVTPAAWAASTLDARYTGTILDATAGPVAGSAGITRPRNQPLALTARQTQLLDYVTRNRDGATYLFATDSWSAASPYILATAAPVLPMGGFSGVLPAPTLAQFQQLVATGQLRHVLLSNGGFSIFSILGRAPAAPQATSTTAIAGWVRQHCTPTPLGAQPGTARDQASAATRGDGALYTCRPGS